MSAVAQALDDAGVPLIEVTHGDGLGGASVNYGFPAASDEEYLRAVIPNLKQAKVSALLIPGIGTVDHLHMVKDCGVHTVRVATHCTEADVSEQHISTAREMEWRERLDTIGIFLTSGTKADVLQSLIATIRVDLPEARIIVRQHPVTLLKTDFSTIGVDDPLIELTIGNPLDDEIAACDMVICGNSGVAMNVLSGGRPVAYLSSLDGIKFDANGFVASRLVLSVPWWTDDIYDRLKGFYQAPGWRGVMQSYDASYGADLDELKRAAAQVMMRHLRPAASATIDAEVGDRGRLVA